MFYQGKPVSKSCYKWVPWATKNNKYMVKQKLCTM